MKTPKSMVGMSTTLKVTPVALMATISLSPERRLRENIALNSTPMGMVRVAVIGMR